MESSWAYVSRLARRSEEIGFDLTLIAELFLNDIKGIDAPSLDAWSTAAALAAVTERLELMVAVRPTFHQPAILAKQAANIDQHRERPAVAQRRVLVVEGRGAPLRRAVRRARRSLCAHGGVARRGRWRVAQPSVRLQRQVLPRDELDRRAEAACAGRGPTIYAGGESEAAKIAHRARVRRVRHARRSARAHRAEDRRHVGASRAARPARRCSSAWRRT